ncbi:MAG: substrate-binding domain-containing protein [Treponema sp.]|nr:substrate-binding domain-containing protein [Treponema sp.]
MEKKTIRLIKWVLLIFSFIALLTFLVLFYSSFFYSRTRLRSGNENNPADTCLYHIMVTGTYENQSFLSGLYAGADALSKSYNAMVDLHVPDSQAGTTSLQELLDYCSFMNADGIIAYIDSPDDTPELLQRTDAPVIPLVTTGQFSANLPQVSYVGINNWELGKKIADEVHSLITGDAYVYIISDLNATNSANLISSLQLALQENRDIQSEVLEALPDILELEENKNIFICLTEDDTIMTAQQLSEQFPATDYKLLGFGGNEVCQLYLQKGYITELFSLDPEKIGETALRELFEYRNKGYANSYITADVRIEKTGAIK